MNYRGAILLLGLLPIWLCHAQTKPQTHVLTKEQQAAQAEAALIAKALAAAKTAAVVVRATTTVSCPGGAPGDCIRTDKETISQIKSLVDSSNLWDYFKKAEPTQADILLDFKVKEGTAVTFTVRDSDSGKILYSDFREVVSLDNDINRLIAHFLVGAPQRTVAEKADYKMKRECAVFAAQYNAALSRYNEKLKDYTWKNEHKTDAIMDECQLHWKDFVCLEASAASQSHGQSAYASNWNQTIVEFDRKLRLEYDELDKTNEQLAEMRTTSEKSGCGIP